MSDSALQDEPTTGSENTAELDLDWQSVEDGEEVRWASTSHKYGIVPALLVGLPLSVVLIGIPLIAASYRTGSRTRLAGRSIDARWNE